MRTKILLVTLLTVALLVWARTPAVAQVPPHQPGTVCLTPYFWCWAPQPGPPGLPCACPTPQGWVSGQLG